MHDNLTRRRGREKAQENAASVLFVPLCGSGCCDMTLASGPDWNATAEGKSSFRFTGSRDEDGESASLALR